MSRRPAHRIDRQSVVDIIRGSDHGEYFGFARRAIRAMARRVSDSDPDDLALMLELRDELDKGIARAVRAQRDLGFSWADIAAPLGMTRQAAQQRWGVDDDRPDLQQYAPMPGQGTLVDYDDVPGPGTPEQHARRRMVADLEHTDAAGD
jgi:hypothetical protein